VNRACSKKHCMLDSLNIKSIICSAHLYTVTVYQQWQRKVLAFYAFAFEIGRLCQINIVTKHHHLRFSLNFTQVLYQMKSTKFFIFRFFGWTVADIQVVELWPKRFDPWCKNRSYLRLYCTLQDDVYLILNNYNKKNLSRLYSKISM